MDRCTKEAKPEMLQKNYQEALACFSDVDSSVLQEVHLMKGQCNFELALLEENLAVKQQEYRKALTCFSQISDLLARANPALKGGVCPREKIKKLNASGNFKSFRPLKRFPSNNPA